MEYIKTVIESYKKDKITNYLLERELSKYLGSGFSVKIANDTKANVNTTYSIFPVPELRTEGLNITVIFNKQAIMNLYSVDELAVILLKIADLKQKIFREFMRFRSDSGEITANLAIGFLLGLYENCFKEALKVGSTGEFFLPDSDIMFKYIDLFNTQSATAEDIESILIQGLIPEEAIILSKNYIRTYSNAPEVKIIDDSGRDLPSLNFGQQEIRKNVTSTWGVQDHAEIKYDYLPNTNQ